MKRKADGKWQMAGGEDRKTVARRWTLRALVLCSIFTATVSKATAINELSAPAAAALVQQVRFDQNLGASVPLDAIFRDESGNPVALRSLLGQRPAVLVMGYHDCPMLCSLVLTGVTEALTELRQTTGKDFDLIDVSISPKDSPADAAKQKRIYFKRYLRQGADTGWHFLTSPDAGTIHLLTDAVGFHYAYDVTTGQYAHPSGLVILTPEGKVSGYMFGVNFDAGQLEAALDQARQRQVGSPIAQLLLTCFHYNPVTGRYGALIMNSLRAAGVLTVLLLAGGIVYLVRRPMPTARA